jgi:anti-sigma-K factor RskA
MNEMQRSHEELLDLVAVYALGAVSADEGRFISAHLAVCNECRREFDALRPTADAIALSVDDRLDAVDCPRIKSRLLKAVLADAPRQRTQRQSRAATIIAALAIAAAVVLGFFALDQQRRIGDLQLAGAHQYTVPDGEILKTSERVIIVMRTLPALPSNRVYQAWTLAPGAKTVAPSITFLPDEHGYVIVSLPQPVAKISAIAVSVEPFGGSPAPTTKSLFVQPLT